MRDCFDKYYIPIVEIKYFNALIDNKIQVFLNKLILQEN